MASLNYEDIASAIDQAGLDPADVIVADYSGRGMGDRTCLGLRVDMIGDAFDILLYMNEAGIDAHDLADRVNEDNLGRNSLFYFPGITVDNSPEDDDE